VPEPVIAQYGARIMGLDDPTKKMSKSESRPGHSIGLLDSPDDIRSKVMKAATDSLRTVRFDESRPGLYNLLVIYESFTGMSRASIEARFEGKGYAEFKKELAEVIIEGLAPLQRRYAELSADAATLDALLVQGASKVRPVASSTVRTVKQKIGLG